ncbi:CLIP domain-containing serine protease B9-like [Anopheles bellator]|uniref:CLIP domain-containing serine protease B9-like n=1 Tax=Anopheles bellator TaxID=139047 RepID=UPI00264733EC|nr:CLIP domain-containing serine protease B9-like [Anopheles bellator]
MARPLRSAKGLWFALALTLASVSGGRLALRHPCITVTELPGRCVPVKQCDNILSTLRKDVHTIEDIRFVEDSACGHTADGKALVCCAQSPPSTSEGPKVDEIARNHSSTVHLPRACGVQTELNSSTVGRHPWNVLLHYKAYENRFFCGGSLISDQYVLTAASCADDTLSWANLTVRLGEWDLDSTVDCSVAQDLVCADPAFDVMVTKVILHEAYRDRRRIDLALLRLAQKVPLNDWVAPVCLPGTTDGKAQDFQAAGWNQNTCGEKLSGYRYKTITNYRAANKTACGRYLSSVPAEASHHMCVSSSERALVVEPGGGLTATKTFDEDRNSKRAELAGVLNSLSNCANFDGHLVFTKIEPFLSWIVEALEP